MLIRTRLCPESQIRHAELETRRALARAGDHTRIRRHLVRAVQVPIRSLRLALPFLLAPALSGTREPVGDQTHPRRIPLSTAPRQRIRVRPMGGRWPTAGGATCAAPLRTGGRPAFARRHAPLLRRREVMSFATDRGMNCHDWSHRVGVTGLGAPRDFADRDRPGQARCRQQRTVEIAQQDVSAPIEATSSREPIAGELGRRFA